MSLDPVIYSKFGKRPLLDLPALDVASGGGTLKPSHLATMAPPALYRPDLQEQQSLSGPQVPMGPRPALPLDWPYAVGLPGSLFAAPPGPMPYKDPQVFPYSFLRVPPLALQRPPYHVTDSSGQPVQAMGVPPDRQPLSQLYPGVHDPYPPQGYFAPDGFSPPGVVPQHPQSLQLAGPQAADPGRVHFEGVLAYGKLPDFADPDKSGTFWGLPEFLRHELYMTYGHVPNTDVRIVARGGEFHVYASPRRTGGDVTGRELAFSDQHLMG